MVYFLTKEEYLFALRTLAKVSEPAEEFPE